MKIHTIEHIEERLTFIQSILDAQYDSDDGNLLSQRITEVGAYMAEAGKLKADAEFHYHEKLKSEIMEALKSQLPEYSSATLQNNLVKSLARHEQHLVTFADRVNRTATHQCGNMITQLSYLKSLPK